MLSRRMAGWLRRLSWWLSPGRARRVARTRALLEQGSLALSAMGAFWSDLLRAVPAFRPDYDDHVRDNDEVLSHVLMGDLTRFFLKARADGDGEAVAACVAQLDRAIRTGDEDVQNVVCVSFLESLPWPGEPDHDAVRATLSPALVSAWDEMINWRPP